LIPNGTAAGLRADKAVTFDLRPRADPRLRARRPPCVGTQVRSRIWTWAPPSPEVSIFSPPPVDSATKTRTAPSPRSSVTANPVPAGGGTLRIEYSTLKHNPSAVFQNAPGIFDDVDNRVIPPVVIHSSIS
jgi:hypothetical protein